MAVTEETNSKTRGNIVLIWPGQSAPVSPLEEGGV